MNKKVLFVLPVLAFTLALVPAGTAQGKKPLRYGCAAMKTDYGWIGTITSEDLTGATIIWITLDMDFHGGETPFDAANVHFYEEWFIGFDIAYVPPTDTDPWDISGTVVLEGWDEGVTRFNNGKFTGNGRVTDASVDYAHLIGRKEHLSGTADLSEWTCTATVQIN